MDIDYNSFGKCSCGVDINDEYSTEKNSYSLWGWFLWSQGATVVPKKMSLYCKKCSKIYFTTKDKNLIKYHIDNKKY